jgi:LacI family transcriptional regulator
MTATSGKRRQPGRSRKWVTMADVARAANVSIGTVSHVLSGARAVRPETRERVEAAIAELGFQPDSVARALVRRRTQTIGMLIPDVTNPFFADLIWRVEQALATVDHALICGNSGNDPDREQRYLQSFLERRVDAIIVGVAGRENLEFLRSVGKETPTLFVDRVIDEDGWDSVRCDNTAGMAMVVDHLTALGHRRMALINGEPGLPTTMERERAARARLAEHGIELMSAATGAFTLESGQEQGRALLAKARIPTAVCAGNDLLAMGMMRAAAEAGLRVPDDISVAGYDDIAYAEYASPPLTTVRQPVSDIAQEIVRLVSERLAGREGAAQHVTLAPELRLRDSTGPAARS